MRWALALLFVLGCKPPGPGRGPEFEGPTEITEVTGRDLSPVEEIDALLEGTTELGRGSARLKIAVLPFDVRTGDEAMGGMVADVIAHALTGAEGVTVLERERVDVLVDEVERTGKQDSDALRKKAKLAGVDAYVLGTVHGDKKDGVVYTRVVDTSGGVRSHELKIPLDRRRWREGVAEKSKELARALGVKDRGRRTEAPHDLDAAALEKATKARELQYSGKIAEAAKLYGEAMPKPSTAWQLETDYLTLMDELEMGEWVEARSAAVLERMPPGPATICTRARLLALRLPDRTKSSKDLEDARHAVRVAASCGDPSVIATALMRYSDIAQVVYTPLAIEAVERAHRLIGAEPGWDRCEVDLRRTWQRVIDGRGGASLRAEMMKHANACAKVHNHHAAALAAMFAAQRAWSLDDSIADLAQGVAWAEKVGGAVLNDLRIAHSQALRRAGYTSAADDELLALVRTWVTATIELHGALPPIESRIDDELLERAKVKRPAGTARELDAEAKLRAAVVRRSLALVLQQWGERTRTDSGPEAAYYADLAADLDPRLRPDNAPLVERLKARGVDPDTLLQQSAAPHRESAPDYPGALDILGAMFHQARGADAPLPERERIVQQFDRLAGWLAAKEYLRAAALLQAQHQADLGNGKHALSELRGLDALAGDDPQWEVASRYPLEIEILYRQGSGAVDAMLERWLAAAKTVSAPVWVDVAGRVEALRLERAPKSEAARATALFEVGNQLIDRKQWLPASDAAYAAVMLLRRANISGGTAQSIDVMQQRVGIVDNLRDPVRSALARTDLLWEVQSAYANAFEPMHMAIAFTNDPGVATLMNELAAQIDLLAKAGRARDAVRIIVSIPGIAPRAEELLGLAERLAPTFEHSLEHPLLMGTWWLRVSERSSGAQYRFALERAFELLDKTDRRDLAGKAMVGLVKAAQDEAQLATDYERCVRLAAGAPSTRLGCLGGMSSYVVSAGVENRRIERPELFRRALVEMDDLAKRYGATMAETDRAMLKESGILLAIAAGDFGIVDALLGEIVAYFEKQSDSPHLGNFGTAVWIAARLSHPAEAVAAIERLAGSKSSNDRFVASMAADAARSAWQLGDAARADRLATTGRAAAERAYADLLFRYDLLAGDRALATKKSADAIAAFERVRDSPEAQRNPAVAAAAAVRLAAARLVRDAKADVPVAVPGLPTNVTIPCAEADWLEIRAAASFARRRCDEGKKLREDAIAIGKSCREPAYRLHSDNACGKPFAPIVGETKR
jgi:hypothetical protein